MPRYSIRSLSSAETPPWREQLAGRIATFSTAAIPPESVILEMIQCRLLDSFAVALAAINRGPVASARAMALAHQRSGGAPLFGLPNSITVDCEWAGFANSVAIRELDFNDTFLAADFAHPSDCIAPILAVAQQTGQTGASLAQAIAVSYEIHIALVKAIDLHSHKKDHVAHLAPAIAAGLGALLKLPAEIIFQAVNQAVHLSFSTRQSRKGQISSWKAFAPAQAGKTAIEAVDRAMRGEGAPSPIYEGEDSVIPWMLAGKEATYAITLPGPGEAANNILESFPKAHSAEYQAQAIIDLAFEVRSKVDICRISKAVLYTSDHTHFVIGTGANDPQKMDPKASRETLDHSIMYILAVALEDGSWHHIDSYTAERASRPSTIDLWQKIETAADPEWDRRYHAEDPAMRAYGGRLELKMTDGATLVFEKSIADAHPNGTKPWKLEDYSRKFTSLAGHLLTEPEIDRFLTAIHNLSALDGRGVTALNPEVTKQAIMPDSPTGLGLFDFNKGN